MKSNNTIALLLLLAGGIMGSCSGSHGGSIVGDWNRQVENSDLATTGREIYHFGDNDTLTVTSDYNFKQSDDKYKCEYGFEVTYSASYNVAGEELRLNYDPESFEFRTKDDGFHIELTGAGNQQRLDSLKSSMEEDLTRFFSGLIKASFDSLSIHYNSFTITTVNDRTLILSSAGEEMMLERESTEAAVE